ncbi:MAG: DnaJ domain-containing protein [Legionella sp.]|nr:DnaJ domain-containing protein [Legionella sp.]
MKNLYKELNLEKNDSADEIRKAYKKHALFCHPDKGGSDEKMQALNQAYQTLINPLKRQAFDQEWEAFQSFDEDTPLVNPANVAYLDQTQSTPFSETFKQQYATLLAQFTLKPQKPSKVAVHFKPFQEPLEKSHPLSEFLTTIEDCLHQPLSPQLAISLLLHRLHEQTTPEQTQCFIERCLKATANPYKPRERDLYQGIAALLRAIETKDPSQSVLTSFEKITNYAFSASPMPRYVSVLLQDHAFRFYFKKSLEKRWLRPRQMLLARFNGKKALDTLVNQLRQNGSAQKSLLTLLKLLRQFEKGLPEIVEKSAKTYREQGFFLLDWIPLFSQHTHFSVVLNTLLQAGIYFQFAASCETNKSHQMADEALAQRLYLLTYSMAQRATPDIALYIGTHILKHLALFHYVDDALPNIITGIQHRVFQLADIFPIYRSIQSNVDLLFQSDEKALHGMRDYLHALIEIVEYNQLSDEPLLIDHRPVTILYQAYEASLKNWYTDEHDPTQENRLRLNLMCELLEEKGWSFDDITQQVDFSWQVKRDEDGWLAPKETLHFGGTNASEIFKSLPNFKRSIFFCSRVADRLQRSCLFSSKLYLMT